jgi:hypothetical protein
VRHHRRARSAGEGVRTTGTVRNHVAGGAHCQRLAHVLHRNTDADPRVNSCPSSPGRRIRCAGMSSRVGAIASALQLLHGPSRRSLRRLCIDLRHLRTNIRRVGCVSIARGVPIARRCFPSSYGAHRRNLGAGNAPAASARDKRAMSGRDGVYRLPKRPRIRRGS